MPKPGPKQSSAQKLQETARETVYLIGAMTGLPNLNFDAFEGAKKALEIEGFKVLSPRHHRKADAQAKVDEDTGRSVREARESAEYQAGIRENLGLIVKADTVFVLTTDDAPVERSTGARLELALCRSLGLPIFLFAADPQDRRPYERHFGIAVVV